MGTPDVIGLEKIKKEYTKCMYDRISRNLEERIKSELWGGKSKCKPPPPV